MSSPPAVTVEYQAVPKRHLLSRPAASALIAMAITLLLGMTECGRAWNSRHSWAPSILEPTETFGTMLSKEMVRWLYLTASTFGATLLCAVVFDYAHRRRRKRLERFWVPCSAMILWAAGGVAYFPEPDWSSGVIVDLGAITTFAPLMAGGAALLAAYLLRRFYGRV
jgi:energy-converting hydrogenase Eha subunit A